MQKRNWKSIALTVASVLAVGIVVLAVHIWWVMKPRPDVKTRIMARIDIKPTESEIANGCPVAGASFAYKAYAFMSHIF